MSLSRDEGTIREGTKPVLFFQLYLIDKNNKKTKLVLEDLSTITLTYFDVDTDATINSRSSQDVKNANNVAINDQGEVRWQLQVLDTTVQDADLTTGELEHHVALFEWATTSGLLGNERIHIYVKVDTKV